MGRIRGNDGSLSSGKLEARRANNGEADRDADESRWRERP